jgi:hypothetical protein
MCYWVSSNLLSLSTLNAFFDALCEVFSCAAETYSAKGLRNLLADKAALHQCKRGMLALGPQLGVPPER